MFFVFFFSNVWQPRSENKRNGYLSALGISIAGMTGGLGFQKGNVARESTLGANHVGRTKLQWLGNNSREARERLVMGSRKSPAVKTEPRKNKIVVSEGQHS